MGENLVRDIRTNLEIVNNKLIEAASKSGRNSEDIRVIVVTKSQPNEVIKAAIEAGVTLLGENYPEEGVEKIDTLEGESAVEWHMIGHVQSRKAELVANHYDYLHSLDGLKLAKKLNTALGESGKQLPVLLEFNVGGEESKYGWQAADENNWTNFLPELEQIFDLPHLMIKGLMTMPPIYPTPELIRPYFSKLRRLRDNLAEKFPGSSLKELSMGTSSDFVIAVEEGATFIRVGQAILGKRLTKRG